MAKTHAIRLSDVEFSTCEYEMNHGAQPRGHGSWGFVAYKFSRSDSYLDHVKWFNGMTYSAAKRAAAAAFASEGVMDVVVCS